MKKTTVIFHSADYDGLFCREIARKFLPDAELIGWDFPDKPLPFPASERIYVMDLPVDRVFGFEFRGQDMMLDGKKAGTIGDYKHIVWIDHHRSSIESHPKDIPGYRIDGVSACRLAWQWFQNIERKKDEDDASKWPNLPVKEEFTHRKVSEPLAVRLAGEYDVWDRRDPDAEILQLGLKARKLNDLDWHRLLNSAVIPNTLNDSTESHYIVQELLVTGRAIGSYKAGEDEKLMALSHFVSFEGLRFLALNTVLGNSLTFRSKDKPDTGHDALLLYGWLGDKWKISLYHAEHRKDIDLSVLAKKHGGGGHPGACGFNPKVLPFELQKTTFQERVVAEKAALDGNRDRLASFLGSEICRKLNRMEQSRLNRQLEAMTLYSNILGERIAAFTK